MYNILFSLMPTKHRALFYNKTGIGYAIYGFILPLLRLKNIDYSLYDLVNDGKVIHTGFGNIVVKKGYKGIHDIINNGTSFPPRLLSEILGMNYGISNRGQYFFYKESFFTIDVIVPTLLHKQSFRVEKMKSITLDVATYSVFGSVLDDSINIIKALIEILNNGYRVKHPMNSLKGAQNADIIHKDHYYRVGGITLDFKSSIDFVDGHIPMPYDQLVRMCDEACESIIRNVFTHSEYGFRLDWDKNKLIFR